MRAAVMYGAGDVRVEDVPDPTLLEPTDAILRVRRACICGSDLWGYRAMPAAEDGREMGHEAIGVVEDVGPEVTKIKRGDLVVLPFAYCDGSCVLCEEGLDSSCLHGGFFGRFKGGGAQGEGLRVPFADATLFVIPAATDESLIPSLLSLSDVMGTGHYAALSAGVAPGKTVAVIGDGAVGLCAVIAAKRLGAEQIIILGHHQDRTDLARRLGATDVVAARGEEAVEEVRRLAGDLGPHCVLECVGHTDSITTAIEIVRRGGAIGRAGIPQAQEIPDRQATFWKNITLAGGPTPIHTCIPELLPDILEGRIEPGLVFDRQLGLEQTPDGYRAMNEREALKVIVQP
ncbi:MAG: alcohol dehydrogenase catalytic domain-containing protein [Actinobacteria bacterium]|nr:alcohol dehydrogenase catalytic domain-containing protein [Actinomycetota bacterium]